jgi:hypothetical protein
MDFWGLAGLVCLFPTSGALTPSAVKSGKDFRITVRELQMTQTGAATEIASHLAVHLMDSAKRTLPPNPARKSNSPLPSSPQMFFAASWNEDDTLHVRSHWFSPALVAPNLTPWHGLAQLWSSGKLRKQI